MELRLNSEVEFLLRGAMLARFAIAWVCLVCLSVRLSVKRWIFIEISKHFLRQTTD